jgi:3-oxoacyl-[acyl-carrier-protein] synthase II
MTSPRVAVTGVGVVSALGPSAEVTFDRLLRGERGFSEISIFDTDGQRTRFAGEVRGFDPAEWERSLGLRPLSRSDALALAAAHDAVRSAGGLGTHPKLGIAVGATTGGMLEAEAGLARLDVAALPASTGSRALASYPMSHTAECLGAAFGVPARVATVCSACSSGAGAITLGALWLLSGEADCVLAGGTDALCRLTVTGFNALGATDTAPCRPFDRRRAGLTLGEGAGFLVLEMEARAIARGARVLAWLTGWAAGAEAHHITQPEATARMPRRLLSEAMRRAGRVPSDIDYLNAHGTGTSNDAVETAGIRAAFGEATDRLLVSSSKGQVGHTLGAAGAIEAAITVLALHRQEVPPTGGLQEPDETCRLQHVLALGRPAPLRAAISSAFGFGGAGAVLLFEHAASPNARAANDDAIRVVVTGIATASAGRVLVGEACADALSGAVDATVPAASILDSLDASRSRRFDAPAALVTRVTEQALLCASLSAAGVGLVTGVAFGGVERSAAFLRTAAAKGARRAPPAEFPHLLPSSVSGNASIYLGLTGPVMTASGLDASGEASVLVARDWLRAGAAGAMVAGGVTVRDAFVRELLGPASDVQEQGRADIAAALVLESCDHAAGRGARILAVLESATELPLDALPSFTLSPPLDAARAVVVVPRDARHLSLLLSRCGWEHAPRRSHGEGIDDGTGIAIAVAAALVARHDADEALAFGWTSARLYAFHLTRPA